VSLSVKLTSKSSLWKTTKITISHQHRRDDSCCLAIAWHWWICFCCISKMDTYEW